MNKIKQQVQEFLNDKSKKRIEIDVPKNFKVNSVVNPITLFFRKIMLFKQKWMVPSRFKNWYLNLAGVNMGYDACIPHYIHFDNYFPELITVDKGSLVGGLSKIFTHEVKDGKLILGRVHIKEKVLLAGISTIHPGVTVNKYVITGMKCQITEDCPENTFVAGHDRVIKEWSEEERERYAGDSNHDPNYYKKERELIRNFQKDRNNMVIKYKYNGKRLNAGDEWFRARFTPRIFYNAIFVELARILPWNSIRILLWRMMGAKIGKNCKIGINTVFDHIYGDLAEIGNNVTIGNDCYIDGHSYTISETVYGRVHIGDNTVVGDDVHFMCGVKVGKNCKILKNSSVLKNILDGETWKGVPAKKVEE